MKPTLSPASLLIIFFVSCNSGTPAIPGKPKEKLPDSSISNLLKLRNPAFTPDSIKAAIKDNVVVLSTRDETRFLIAYQYPGDPPGSFIGFEITGLTTDLANYPYMKTTIEDFETENGIAFVPSVEEILRKRGKNYEKTNEDGAISYKYYDAPEDFLKRHNSTEYMFEIQAIENYPTRIRFGFLLPSPDSTEEGNGQLQKIDTLGQ